MSIPREDPNAYWIEPLERVYREMHAAGSTVDDIAYRLHISQGAVRNALWPEDREVREQHDAEIHCAKLARRGL